MLSLTPHTPTHLLPSPLPPTLPTHSPTSLPSPLPPPILPTLFVNFLSVHVYSWTFVTSPQLKFTIIYIISCAHRVTILWPSFTPPPPNSFHIIRTPFTLSDLPSIFSFHSGWPYSSHANSQTRVAEDQTWRKIKGRCIPLTKFTSHISSSY